MKKYSKMKDSGVPWIGMIPEHWNTIRLKQSVSLICEKTSDKSLTYIGLENVESKTGTLLECSYEPDADANKFEKGDVLFCKLRPYLAKCFLSDFDGKCSSELLVLRNYKGWPNYLKYVMLSNGFISLVNASTYGAKMPRASWNFIGNVKIPDFTKEEQKAIAKYLDEKTSQINELVANKKKQIDLLKEYKQAFIADAVTGKLGGKRKMKDSGIPWIGQIPENWGLCRAKYMFAKQKREVRDFDEVVTCFRDGEVTLRKNRRTTGFTESLTEIGYQGIRKNDLVIHQMDAFAGAIGVSDSDGKGTSVYHCCTPQGDYNVHYYSYLLRLMARKGWIQALYRGIRERSSDFNFQVFGNQFLAVPPRTEQDQIVVLINDKCSKIDSQIDAIDRQIEQLNEYKQSLISDVVTGKVKVCD